MSHAMEERQRGHNERYRCLQSPVDAEQAIEASLGASLFFFRRRRRRKVEKGAHAHVHVCVVWCVCVFCKSLVEIDRAKISSIYLSFKAPSVF